MTKKPDRSPIILSLSQFTVILRLPQPRYESWCLRKSDPAAEDAEGPPTYMPEREGAKVTTQSSPQPPGM
jgi:hypothetical protein